MNTVVGQPPLPVIATVASIVTASTSGRSSRSTFTLTNRSFITAAVPASSNDSCAITWHQWQALYPTETSSGLSSARASANASSPHGCQSTGFVGVLEEIRARLSARRFMLEPYAFTALPGRCERRATPSQGSRGRATSRACSRAVAPGGAVARRTRPLGDELREIRARERIGACDVQHALASSLRELQ